MATDPPTEPSSATAAPVTASAHGDVLAPPRALLAVLFASLFGCVLTAGYAYRYTVMWERERAGKTIEQQRLTMAANVPVFGRTFMDVTEQIREILPAGTKVFYQPLSMGSRDDQRARWFLFLTYYLHPLEVYVRKPDLAAGTLVTYPGWNAYHRDPETSGLKPHEGMALVELGIEWKLRMPHGTRFFGNEVRLERLIDGNWVRWDIWTNKRWVPREGN